MQQSWGRGIGDEQALARSSVFCSLVGDLSRLEAPLKMVIRFCFLQDQETETFVLLFGSHQWFFILN